MRSKFDRGMFEAVVCSLAALALYSCGGGGASFSERSSLQGDRGSYLEATEDEPATDGGTDDKACDNPNEPQVMVCHIPRDNPEAKHTICVSQEGAIHGHGVDFETGTAGGHGGDTPGSCDNAEEQPQN